MVQEVAKYNVGDRVYWRSLATTHYGTIVGYVYWVSPHAKGLVKPSYHLITDDGEEYERAEIFIEGNADDPCPAPHR